MCNGMPAVRLVTLLLTIAIVGSLSSSQRTEAQEKPAASASATPAAAPTKPKPPLEIAAPSAPPAKINDTDFTKFSSGDLFVLSRTAAREGHYPVAAIAQYWYVRKANEGRYDLACYLSRAGQADAAFYWLQLAAIEEGLDTREVEHDPDLETLYKDARWPKMLGYIKECRTYFETAPITRTVLIVPKGYDKTKPITAIVWLHGYLSGPDDFVNAEAQRYADTLNVALIGISATKSRGPRSFMWAVDVEKDYARVRAGLAEVSDRVTVEKGKLIALGFSQGGQLAVEVAVRHPDEFAGAIAFSAGSRSQLAGVTPAESLKQRGFVLCVNGKENPGTVALTKNDADWLAAAGAKLIHKVYPDVAEHTFPEDFDERFGEWVKFVLDAAR
jgi:predicted esterase